MSDQLDKLVAEYEEKTGREALYTEGLKWGLYNVDFVDEFLCGRVQTIPTLVHANEPMHKILPILIKDDKGNEFLLENFQQVLDMVGEVERLETELELLKHDWNAVVELDDYKKCAGCGGLGHVRGLFPFKDQEYLCVECYSEKKGK